MGPRGAAPFDHAMATRDELEQRLQSLEDTVQILWGFWIAQLERRVNELEEHTRIKERKEHAARKALGMQSLDDVERDHVMSVYVKSGRNKTETAKALGVNIKTVYAKLKRWGIP